MSKFAPIIHQFVLFLFLCSGFNVAGQGTGSFNTNITFMGAQRQLSCYVPTNYTPTTPVALMVGLHGLGDNSVNYRNAWTGANAFQTNIPNTILICPDGGSDPQKDFYAPAGDEAIIEECIKYARMHYNIDTTEIILQGFSLGGRSALRYGLQHTGIFKGLLLHTPAVQGVKEAVETYANGGLYNYANAPATPIYITHGSTDVLYTAPVDSTYEQLVRNNAKVRLLRFTGGHTVPPFVQQAFGAFFEQPAQVAHDVNLVRVSVPARSCTTSVAAKVLLQNTGAEPVTSIHLKYGAGTASHSYTWSGNLLPFAHAEIELPAFTQATAGQYTLTVAADTLNGTTPDEVTTNNNSSAIFRITTTATALPLEERFDNANYENSWLLKRSGDFLMPLSYDDDLHALFSFNSIFVFDNSERREEILSPVLDVTNTSQLFASFDVAYNYTRFTAALSGIDTVFADTLQVMISNDCGQTFQTVYSKGGTTLATYPQPITDPSSLNAYELNPAQSNWRREQVNLSSFLSTDQVIIKFSYKSALGGAILLDNITFNQTGTGIKEAFIPQVSLSPNPATDQVTILSGDDKIKVLKIYDLAGRMITTIPAGSNTLQVPVATLENGVYLFEVQTARGKTGKKVVIQH